MILIFLLGLAAPFLFIFGSVFSILWLPIGSTISWLKPYWLRLPRQRRSQIKKTVLWLVSTALWTSIVFNWN